ncbi:MAG: DUF4365 domain-containing protein [Synergistaceae bacterium]|jgi:hypothetical protein|nr:DUF4365 domain-containing protein [Synergistaceae bacterium]
MNERISLYSVGRASAELQGILFREQIGGDIGLNAHLDVLSDKRSAGNGKPVGLCVLSDSAGGRPGEGQLGLSRPTVERGARGYVCRGKGAHLAYWFQHSIPVIVMVHEMDSDRVLWESADGAEVEASDGALADRTWKLVVPFDQVYGQDTVQVLKDLPCPSLNFARLAIDKPWMEFIEQGGRLVVETDEWINRPSSRGDLRLRLGRLGGDSNSIYEWSFRVDPDTPYVFRLPELFPWASMSIGGEGTGIGDLSPIRPYIVDGGEIARFALELSLNDVGRAFLTTERFLRDGQAAAETEGRIGEEYENGIKYRLRARG